MKRILITGGAGFLGSHLCKSLINENEIICMDNLYTGSLENIREIRAHKNFTFINHDIIEKIHVSELDTIYNMACPASPPKYQARPIETMLTCVVGLNNLLELAAKNNSRIFHASTSEVYGDPLISPQTEDYKGNVSTTGIRACYDEGKRAAEALMLDHNRVHGIDYRMGRIFNTYGEFMDKNDGRVVTNFINQALEGKDITIFGDGHQTRSFCHVSDTVSAIIKLTEKDTNSGIVNIGNPNEITMLTLACMIIEITGSKSEIIFKDLPQDDPKRRCPDISKATSSIDWEPKVKLIDGLESTINYFKDLQHGK